MIMTILFKKHQEAPLNPEIFFKTRKCHRFGLAGSHYQPGSKHHMTVVFRIHTEDSTNIINAFIEIRMNDSQTNNLFWSLAFCWLLPDLVYGLTMSHLFVSAAPPTKLAISSTKWRSEWSILCKFLATCCSCGQPASDVWKLFWKRGSHCWRFITSNLNVRMLVWDIV